MLPEAPHLAYRVWGYHPMSGGQKGCMALLAHSQTSQIQETTATRRLSLSLSLWVQPSMTSS
jgi:hypothetical protein